LKYTTTKPNHKQEGRFLNKRQLISIIEQLKTFDASMAKVKLEQYATDAVAAVEMVFIAGFMHDDLHDRLVLDLGTGTGRLAISALCMGARHAIGIELDNDAIMLARQNARDFNLLSRYSLVQGDVLGLPLSLRRVAGACTVLMNPPFGVQEKGADARFLQAAMAIDGVDVIYSFHLTNEGNRAFLKKLIGSCSGWMLSEIHQTKMILPHLYAFHEKKRKEIDVDIYRLLNGSSSTT
jgi:predicted RNA methylase